MIPISRHYTMQNVDKTKERKKHPPICDTYASNIEQPNTMNNPPPFPQIHLDCPSKSLQMWTKHHDMDTYHILHMLNPAHATTHFVKHARACTDEFYNYISHAGTHSARIDVSTPRAEVFWARQERATSATSRLHPTSPPQRLLPTPSLATTTTLLLLGLLLLLLNNPTTGFTITTT